MKKLALIALVARGMLLVWSARGLAVCSPQGVFEAAKLPQKPDWNDSPAQTIAHHCEPVRTPAWQSVFPLSNRFEGCCLRRSGPVSLFGACPKRETGPVLQREKGANAGIVFAKGYMVPATIRRPGCNRGKGCRLCFRAEPLRLALASANGGFSLCAPIWLARTASHASPRVKLTIHSPFPSPGESKGAEKHPLPVADTGGFSAPQPRKQKTGFNACLLFATAARREQALLAVSIREVRRRGRKRNLPRLRVVSFVPFLWTSKEKGTAQGMTCKHTKANAQKGAVSKLRVILSIAKNLVPEVQKNLEGKDPSSLRSSG